MIREGLSIVIHDDTLKGENDAKEEVITGGEHKLKKHYEDGGNYKLLIDAHEDASVTRVLTSSGKGTVHEEITIKARPGVTVTYNEVQLLNEETSWKSTRTGLAAKNANIKYYTHTKGGYVNSQTTTTALQGKAEAIVLHTTTQGQYQESHRSTKTIHESPETKSGMYGKAVIKGKARALHKGNITIGERAAGSEAYQQEDVLILEDAQANTIPELAINNGEVSCSHGSTIGSLDEEALFYLRSRGLDEKEATRLVTTGFLASILQHADEEWQKDIIRLQEETI